MIPVSPTAGEPLGKDVNDRRGLVELLAAFEAQRHSPPPDYDAITVRKAFLRRAAPGRPAKA